ncbi:MAG: hypothetical protein LBC80_02665 [Treponema sp.]|jgi:hypothetical protein|nr:hypothetical protein [Treponema sp.]
MTSKEKQIRKSQEKSSNLTENYTFNDVVDNACEKLMNCKIKYSISQIQEMEKNLRNLEHELNAFLEQRIES